MLASIREVGVIEPLIVHPQNKTRDGYLLLDGHMRLKALLEIGGTEAFCLVANDDAFTYYDKVMRPEGLVKHVLSAARIYRTDEVRDSAPEAQARRNAAGVVSLPAPQGRIMDTRLRRTGPTPARSILENSRHPPPLTARHYPAASQ